MLRKPFLLTLLEAANMQRWNDKIRPVDLRELDKQAHKMVIAYVLGRFEEEAGTPGFDWIRVIEGGLFEFLQRLVLTDLKPQLFHRIRADAETYRRVNEFVYREIEPVIRSLGSGVCRRFRAYLGGRESDINRKVLTAAHFCATRWEFAIIERANPGGYEIAEIRRDLDAQLEKNAQLAGVQRLTLSPNLRDFVDLCGMLRFQIRWSHIHRVPRTSVLGHMLIVAILSYLFTLEIGGCRRRLVNNYFTGLFHDLPEVLTRDIINPVKRSVEGLDRIIRRYEREEMGKIYGLLPPSWREEMRLFTEDEFSTVVMVGKKRCARTPEEVSRCFNDDRYQPRDGDIVRAMDDLAAFLEAQAASDNGIRNRKLDEARAAIRKKYLNRTVCGVRLGDIFADFD